MVGHTVEAVGRLGLWLLFLHQICKVDMWALQRRDGSQQKKELSKHDQKA